MEEGFITNPYPEEEVIRVRIEYPEGCEKYAEGLEKAVKEALSEIFKDVDFTVRTWHVKSVYGKTTTIRIEVIKKDEETL
ncbi:hypothetical protein DRJ19_05045 [Candidatus Woesearchaeota archaeon]|nr:MAG: hypothetical protein DRJ19_05045 [Candidatus Woesearchaeota archaeon]